MNIAMLLMVMISLTSVSSSEVIFGHGTVNNKDCLHSLESAVCFTDGLPGI